LEGIEVNEDTIALETIENVGIRGTYLMEDHTIQHLRSGEHVELDVSNGANYDMWKSRGGKNICQKARDIAGDILSKGNKCPIDRKMSDELLKIIKEYETGLT
jgi:trimethylamine--corrinoid protein Co-methyltransferase